ncbi:MAG: methyl-accepting chemotaxis sensory transducer with Cache sensor [Oscillospiraceae bacterium]|nr:methyl-accepting chemotaxis sensory transducer with Cache sensor [Oscillospiraceae bacterium]
MEPTKINKKSIKKKLISITLLGVLIPTCIFAIGLMYALNTIGEDSQNVASEKLLSEAKNSIQYQTQVMVTNSQASYQKLSTTIEENKLIPMILDNIRNSKYGEFGYYFVYKYDGIRLVSPENLSLEGENAINTKDKNGVMVIQEVINQSKSGGGFFSYIWKNPATNQEEQKITYAAPLKIGSQEYAIGTGTYLPVLEATKKEIRDDIGQTQRSMLLLIPVIVVIVVLIIILSIFYYNRILIKPIRRLTSCANKIALGNIEDHIVAESQDEIGELTNSFSEMIDNIREQSENAKRIAQGDLGFEITEKSEKDELSLSMKENPKKMSCRLA